MFPLPKLRWGVAQQTHLGVNSPPTTTDPEPAKKLLLLAPPAPVERNYDFGERELLAVKLALEECWHWLEGTELPFIIWIDHKNIEYI